MKIEEYEKHLFDLKKQLRIAKQKGNHNKVRDLRKGVRRVEKEIAYYKENYGK